ncbi:hypothetical protein GGI00_003887, partial [Coemansia sp. RSA 2681]
GANEMDVPALINELDSIMSASSLDPDEHGARLLLATLGRGFANRFKERIRIHLRKGKPTTWPAMSKFMLETFPPSFTKEDAWRALQRLKWDGKGSTTQFNNDFEEMRVYTGIDKRDERIRHTYLSNIPWVYRNPIITHAAAMGWEQEHSVDLYYDYMATNITLLRLLTKYDATAPATQRPYDNGRTKADGYEQQRTLRMNSTLPRQPYAQRPGGPLANPSSHQQQRTETTQAWRNNDRNNDRKNSATIRQVDVADDAAADDDAEAAVDNDAFTIDVSGVFIDNHYDDYDSEIDGDYIDICQTSVDPINPHSPDPCEPKNGSSLGLVPRARPSSLIDAKQVGPLRPGVARDIQRVVEPEVTSKTQETVAHRRADGVKTGKFRCC